MLLACVSAAAGFALRGRVSRMAGRILLVLGTGLLVLAIAVFGIMISSQGRMIGMWTAGLLSVVFLVVAAVILAFGLGVSWGHRRP